MPILSRAQQFSNAQAITATAASTNVIDTGATGTVYMAAAALARDLGKGTSIPLSISVVQNFNNLTSLTIAYQVATDAAFTTPVTVIQSPAYTLAQLNSGINLQPTEVPVNANLRYHRLYYTVAGTAPTLGQITAALAMGVQTNANL